MPTNAQLSFSPDSILAEVREDLDDVIFDPGEIIFDQGEPSDKVFFIREGIVKVTVTSRQGKEAVLGIFGKGDFLGELCLCGETLRMSAATAISSCSISRIAKDAMLRLLGTKTNVRFCELFVRHLLARNARVEADLVDQLFNPSEKRLARTLLLLANIGKEGEQEPLAPKINQELLAEMVGTTRSRVSHFMNKFRRLGFIDYSHTGRIEVHSSLLNVLRSDHEEG